MDGYEVDIRKPVCPCCGQRLYVKDKNIYTKLFIGNKIDESYEVSNILLQRIQEVADEIRNEEIEDCPPEYDINGKISNRYNKRFEYTSKELRNAIKRAANLLHNEFKIEGIDIDIWYIEQEIYDCLKMFSH